MSNNSYNDVPELGDSVTFLSTLHGKTRGRIIFRDGSLIRIKPRGKGLPVDFPLDAEGLFDEAIGVTEVLIHEKRADPHFSIQLGVFPGDTLDLLRADGTPLENSGSVVFEVIADDHDAIKLHDGTVLDFNFRGPPPESGLVVVIPRASLEAPLPAENEGSASATAADAEAEEIPELDLSLLPAALVEEVESADILYSDTVQREEMFNELLLDESDIRQRDPNVMTHLYRTVDLLLALKNSVLPRDKDGSLMLKAPLISYTASTVQESIQKQPLGAPIAAVVPVAGVKKVLYLDDLDETERTDVVLRSDNASLLSASSTKFNNNVPKGSILFGAYMMDLLSSSPAILSMKSDVKQIQVDQDVFRSQLPPAEVQGFLSCPPATTKKGVPILLGADSIGTISDRTTRLLSASRIVNPKTGDLILVAPADTADTVGHVLLSPNLARERAPIRSSVLLWDIEASERSRAKRTSFYRLMTSKSDSYRSITAEEPVSIAEELEKRLGPELNLWNRNNTYVLDSLGLRTLELTSELMTPLIKNLESSQATWNEQFEQQVIVAAKRMEQPSLPSIENYATLDSALFTSMDSNESFQMAVARIQEIESSLREFDLAIATHLTEQDSLTSLWYAVASDSDRKEMAEQLYLLEEDRKGRITAVRRNRSREFTAKPIINPCPHRAEYEKIMAVRNDAKRMKLLEPFLNKYKGAVKDNWIQCNRCQHHLVCKHEVLLLREYKQPDRGEILHKTLLMEFMSSFVFEGSFICKNCGQKIQDLEYDNHMEWGADGPMAGRSVVEANADADFTTEEAQPVPKEDMALYKLLRDVFEPCGLFVEQEVYTRAIETVKDYKKARLYSQAQYKVLLEKKLAKIPYNEYEATIHMGIVGAVVVMELQTFEKEVTIPSPICPFSLKGFPLDGKTVASGTGSLDYVSCIISRLYVKEWPWTEVSWRGLTGEARTTAAKTNIVSCVNSLLGYAAKPEAPVTHVTELYTLRLFNEAKKKRESGTKGAPMASLADRLPAAFRPLPAIVLPPETPIGNAEAFLENVDKVPVAKLLPIIADRQFGLTQQGLSAFHTSAKASAVASFCSYRRLGKVETQGCGVQSLEEQSEAGKREAEVVQEAVDLLVHRDTTKSACGTHIYVPWSAPRATVIEATTDSSEYYALFLKHCYKGLRYGLAHELGATHQCRNCGFQYPKEILFMTPANIAESNQKKFAAAAETQIQERKETIQAAFATQSVDITESTFRALEIKIRERKRVALIPPVTIPTYLASLQSLTADWLLPTERTTWDRLLGGLTEIQTAGYGLEMGARLPLFRPFSIGAATVKPRLRERMLQLLGASKEALVMEALAGLEHLLTPVDGVLSVRTFINLLIVSGGQLATNSNGSEFLTKEAISKWISNISSSHQEDIGRIWERAYSSNREAILVALDEKKMSPASRDARQNLLKHYTTHVGLLFQGWSVAVRPGVDITLDEYKLILDWMVHSALLTLLSPESPLYREMASDVDEVGTSLTRWLLDSITKARGMADIYHLSKAQIQAIIDAVAEKERNKIIAEFDTLGDLRQVELVWKRNKVGRWNYNPFTLDPEIYEAQKQDRALAGVTDGSEEVAGGEASRRELIYRLNQDGAMDDATNLGARQDEDEGGVGDE